MKAAVFEHEHERLRFRGSVMAAGVVSQRSKNLRTRDVAKCDVQLKEMVAVMVGQG